jgi:hypothetical protein
VSPGEQKAIKSAQRGGSVGVRFLAIVARLHNLWQRILVQAKSADNMQISGVMRFPCQCVPHTTTFHHISPCRVNFTVPETLRASPHRGRCVAVIAFFMLHLFRMKVSRENFSRCATHD